MKTAFYMCEWCGGTIFGPQYRALRCKGCGIFINVPEDFRFQVLIETRAVHNGGQLVPVSFVEAEIDRGVWWELYTAALWG